MTRSATSSRASTSPSSSTRARSARSTRTVCFSASSIPSCRSRGFRSRSRIAPTSRRPRARPSCRATTAGPCWVPRAKRAVPVPTGSTAIPEGPAGPEVTVATEQRGDGSGRTSASSRRPSTSASASCSSRAMSPAHTSSIWIRDSRCRPAGATAARAEQGATEGTVTRAKPVEPAGQAATGATAAMGESSPLSSTPAFRS